MSITEKWIERPDWLNRMPDRKEVEQLIGNIDHALASARKGEVIAMAQTLDVAQRDFIADIDGRDLDIPQFLRRQDGGA